jgi:hypothetical protein
MPKKGGFIDLTTMFSSGVGAYAAKQSGSMSELIMTLVKYALVIIAITIGLIVVLRIFGMATEGFMVPVKPSAEGDEKVVTPAGNVIMY